MMDPRYSLADILNIAVHSPAVDSFQSVRGTATLYFPLYHKSYKDFSELLLGDMEEKTEYLIRAMGPLLGKECVMIKNCVLGGLYYERGELKTAQEYAFMAAAELKDDFAPESKFCAMILLLEVTHALGLTGEEDHIQRDIQKMIERDSSYYLQHNFEAVILKNRLDYGDTEAAKNWIETRGSDCYVHLDYMRLYGHFATARAYMALENYTDSIVLLDKILNMCRSLNCTIDAIEAEILLAAAYSKKKRSNRKKALYYLEEAITCAQQFGYEQAFINNGAKIKNLLTSLKNWTARSDYNGRLSGVFVKKLYLGAAGKTAYTGGNSCDRKEREIKLTRKQKQVARLMCEGYSYRKIAEELGVKFSTVRSHIELIYRKLDVSGMDEAVMKIRKLHLADER